MPRSFPASCLLFSSLTLAASELVAQSSAMEKLQARLQAPDQYGVECCQLLPIPAPFFVPKSTATPAFQYSGIGYISVYLSQDLWAPVVLPTGAVLDFIDLYYNDFDAAEDVCATLTAFPGPTLGGNPPSLVEMGSVCSSGSGGYGYRVEEISGTIENSVWFSNGAQYAVVLTSGNDGGLTTVKGVSIWWHREVRPAPATATFNDVPTSHPQFQFIEALAESGITAGCGSGNYCPDSPLTRGQMAVFLSKALGLYWPF